MHGKLLVVSDCYLDLMSGSLRITTLGFHAGRRPGDPGLEIKPGTVLIFVGPNNSGKSLALREIESWCVGQDTDRKVVRLIELDFPDSVLSAGPLLKEFEASPPPGQIPTTGKLWVGQHTFRLVEPTRHQQIDEAQFNAYVTQRNLPYLRAVLGALYTVRLDGRTRFSLADPKPTGDLQLHPQNHLWALFVDDDARVGVRNLTNEAFSLNFVIDPTGMNSFRIRMSTRPPSTKAEEQALDKTARDFHHQAVAINDLSDGVQAFVGLVSAILSLPHKVILIDEPEAFLHPPLARRLGSNLARISGERNASLVVSTHSAEFLMGCIEAVPDTAVVRLTYEAATPTARALSAAQITELTRDPLLRSTGVLSALFHRAAVVTESDADRAFYAEVNRRLDTVGRGIGNALFLNAQNKQTVRRLVGPLRSIGIPAAALVDLDFLEDSGATWDHMLRECQVPGPEKAFADGERAYLASVFAGLPGPSGKDRLIKKRGISALGTADQARASQLLQLLRQYGLFLVPGGELEVWLPQLSIPSTLHGPDWLIEVFERIGQVSTDSNYLHASTGGVWEFIDSIATWVNNQSRAGTD